MEALGAGVATHVTDACQTLVVQTAATGVEAALAKGRAADHKSALAKAENVQGNIQRALDQALNLATNRGEQLVTVRGARKTAEEGRQKAEVEGAQLRVEVEALRRRGDDPQHRLGVAEAQVCSLTSTLSATYSAHQGMCPPRVQTQGSGRRSGSPRLVGLPKGLPKGIFRWEERYGAQVDMCHFGFLGSANPNPSTATLRPPLTPLVVSLNEYCTWNAPPWFTWCSIQVVRPHGTDSMGPHAHLRDGAPMALIVCVGSLTGGDFWVEGGGLLHPSMRDKKRHTRVCKGRAVEGWACKATPQAPVLFNTRALHAPLPWEGERWSVIFSRGVAALHAYVAAAACLPGF